MGPPDSHRVPRAPRYSGYRPGTRIASRKGLSPAAARLSRRFRSQTHPTSPALQPRERRDARGLGSAPFARHYWGYHFCFLFLRVLRCFSSPGSPPAHRRRMHGLRPCGLPHSDIRGSTVACTYPRLFAACHVLHRLPEPRHPPCALYFFRRRSNTHTYTRCGTRLDDGLTEAAAKYACKTLSFVTMYRSTLGAASVPPRGDAALGSLSCSIMSNIEAVKEGRRCGE